MSKILANQIANYGDDAPIEIKEGLNIPAGKPIQAAGSAGSAGQVLSTTGTSIAWVAAFDGDYNSLSNKPTIPAAQINSDWNATSGVGVILNKPVVPPQSSVTTAAAGTAALSYNSTNGEFTFTPPDLSGYATEAWVGSQGYLTSYTETDTLDTVTGRGATTANTIQVGRIDIGSGSQSILPSGTNDVTFQNTFTGGQILLRAAGNVEIQSYQGSRLLATNTGAVTQGGLSLYYATGLTTEVVRLTTTSTGLTLNGNVELGTGDLTTTGKLFYSNNFATTGDLPNATTYHGMFAHVHAEGHGYFAHAGAWIQLLDTGSSINELADVTTGTISTGDVLTWSGSAWTASAPTGGSGSGANVTISDTIPAGTPSAGDLWWESDTGRLKIYYEDVDTGQWVDTNPPLAAASGGGGSSTGNFTGNFTGNVDAGVVTSDVFKKSVPQSQSNLISISELKAIVAASADFAAFKTNIAALTDN